MFAERLKQIMVEKGVTQSELAKMTGIGRSSICQYLSGKIEPPDERICMIAESLGVSPEELGEERIVASCDPRIERLSIRQAAKIMGMNHETVKQGLIQGVFPWGYAVKTSAKRYTFFINAKKFAEIEGVKI